MKFDELPPFVQEILTADRAKLSERNFHSAYEVLAYNPEGTRYFHARRVCHAWGDDKGHSMPFGGGSHWTIVYGAVQFRYVKCVMGTYYELCDGKRFGRSANRTEIPSVVKTKKEVMDILTKIGIFKFPEIK